MSGVGPRVSIVIPAFNACATLVEALDSLARQSVADWEAVVVDDGSSDGTADIVRSFSKRDQRIRFVEQRNSGVSAARNAGIAVAHGELLVFLDADDWLAPDHLSRLLHALDTTPGAAVAYCGYSRVGADKSPIMTSWCPDIATRPAEIFADRCAAAIHCFLVPRRLVQSVGGFDAGLVTCEDWDLWQRIARTGAKFVGVPDVHAFYRTGLGSLSGDIHQLVRDAARVVASARAPDPRVADPDPRYVDSLVCTSVAEVVALFVIWCVAYQAAKGVDAVDLLDGVPEIPNLRGFEGAICDAIYEGLVVGSGLPPAELSEAWPRARDALLSLTARFDTLSSRGGIGREVLSALERRLLSQSDLEEPVSLVTWSGVRLDISRPLTPITTGPGIDGVHCRICAGATVLGVVEIPAFGVVSSATLADIAIQSVGARALIREGGWAYSPSYWAALGAGLGRAVPQLSKASAARVFGRHIAMKPLLSEVARRSVHACLRGAPSVSNAIISDDRVRRLSEQEELGVRAIAHAPPRDRAERPKPRRAAQSDRGSYWEDLFERPDPWDYGSAYEKKKYQRTLSLLGDEPVERAVELACAEGIFTGPLARHVKRLIAADISERALARARERCREHSNIDFRKLDLVDDALPDDQDLIVCSEVLYYLTDVAQLATVATKIRDALSLNGRLLTAHAYVLTDDPDRTGFDWGHPFGAKVIAETFAGTAGLVLEKSIQTDLYRVDLFRRTDNAALPMLHAIAVEPTESPLTVEVERHIIWNGAVLRRADASRVVTNRVPVLAYHRIAEEGPEALAAFRVTPFEFEQQMRFLRRNGYHSISAADLMRHRRSRTPMHGRPVLISFDDGYLDFYRTAWPILRRSDFTAEVFLPTDLIGADAAWDGDDAHAAPLMSWDDIVAASADGAHFSSHLASHSRATALSAETLLREAVRSRLTIEARLGGPVHSVALPYGAQDERAVRILFLAGYQQIFGCERGLVSLDHWASLAPRLTVGAQDTLDTFEQYLETPMRLAA